ncbi:hypothetical protein Pfo_011549 [Paulownia fortunei]|nr:hypothetical protein Pfo_011549 [Paulownia fortunei]
MHCSARLFYHNLIPTKPLLAPCASPPNPNLNLNSILRRDFSFSSLLLLLVTPDQLRAETINSNAPSNCADPAPTKQAFLDISIEGEPIGRIIIGLYGNAVPAGAARFAELVSGAAGVSYRRKEFVKIMPNYVQHGGLRSYGADAELARKTGSNLAVDNLVHEWEKQNENCQGTKNVAKSVSIIVRDPLKLPQNSSWLRGKGS